MSAVCISQNSFCLESMIGYLDSMNTIPLPNNGKVYYLQYNTSIKYNKKENIPDISTTTDIIMGENKQVVEDKNMKVYADDKNVFVVIPLKKIIYWNSSDPKIFSKNIAFSEFIDLEKKMLQNANVTCTQGSNKIYIEIVPDDKFKRYLSLKKQKVIYDLSSKRIESVTNYFNENNSISEQTIFYEIIDYDSAIKIKDASVNYIFASGSLRKAYQDYTIIDNRTK